MNHEKDVLFSAVINRGENANSKVIKESTEGVDRLEEFNSKQDTTQDDVTLRYEVTEGVLTPRRVSFPEKDSDLVTGYLEPANPWESISAVKTVSELSELYTTSCRKHNTEPLKSVLDHLKTIEISKSMRQSCLSLKNNSLTPDSCEALEEILKRVQYEVIDLSECQLNDTAASALFDMIEYYEAANELDISSNPDLSSRGLQSCISMIRRSRALQILTIRGTPLSESNASSLGKSLNNSFLHTLKLEHCGLKGRPMAALSNALKRNSSMKELWLAHNDLSVSDAEKLADMLRSNGYLEFLDISNNSIKDLGVRSIVKALIEQSSNIEEDNLKYLCDTTELSGDNELDTNSSPPMKNANSGRSMLDTLLTMNSKLQTAEIEKTADDDDWDFGQTETNKCYEEPKISEEMACSERTVGVVNDVIKEDDMNPEKQQNPLISTNNNEYSTCNVSNSTTGETQVYQTKALDFNKNTKIDEMETSSDSAFESASEGDTRFKETLKINNYKQVEFLTDHYTKDPNISNENLSDSGIAFSESRLRSFSSDSLSSDNSLDTSDTNLLDKINEKITKNDTLSRQKHIEEPKQSTKKPKGLQALILWNNNITRESGEYISDLLATTNSLELLNIGKNILSNDFIAKIEESLRTNSTLTNLGLQSSHLSCAGIKTLSSVLQFGGNCTLKRIDIRDNNLQVEALSALAEALKSNKSVTRVDVDDVPKRISDGANEMQFHYSRVLHALRSLCSRNHSSQDSATITNNVKKTGKYLTSRKISLTCPSIRTPVLESSLKMDQLSVDIKKKSNVRLRSPLPSPPTASPSSSPVPSPSRSRFQVFRVNENKTTSPTSPENNVVQKEISKFANPFKSRFQVTLVKSSEIVDATIKDTKSCERNSGNLLDKSNNTSGLNLRQFKLDDVIGDDESSRNNLPTALQISQSVKSIESSQNSSTFSSINKSASDLGLTISQSSSVQNSIKIDTPKTQISLGANTDNCESITNHKFIAASFKTADILSGQTSTTEHNNESQEEKKIFNSALSDTSELIKQPDLNISVNNRTSPNESSILACSKGSALSQSCSTDQTMLKEGSVLAELRSNKELEESNSFSENGYAGTESTPSNTVEININRTQSGQSEECQDITDSTTTDMKEFGTSVSDQTNVCDNPTNDAVDLNLKSELSRNEGEEPRVRKSSWISTSACPTTVDKLLSLFHHPAHLFTRTSSPERDKRPEDSEIACQSLVSVRKQSPPGGLFSWHKSSGDLPKFTDVKRLSTENMINSSFQASFLDVASKQIRGIADFGKQVFRQNITFGDAVNTEPQQSCETIPTEVKLEIKENISPEHTITQNSIAFFQAVQQDNKTPTSVQSDNEENSQSVHPTPVQSGKLNHDPDFGSLVSSDIAGNNL